MEADIEKMLKEGHIRKVERINDEVSIQPVVITVKKHKSFKVALDAISLNGAIQKEKYQIPNLDNLMEQVAEIINEEIEGEIRFYITRRGICIWATGTTPGHSPTL